MLADYGTKLFPRAIGYSAGLINYFFRGTVGIQAPTRYVYGLAEYKANNSSAFTKIKAQVSNTSPAGEETSGPGTAWAVLRYRTPTDSSDLFVNPCANLSDTPTYTASAPVTVALGRSPIELTFDFSSSPIPTNSADLFMYVVYQGTLGLEDNAVLVGTKDLYEPFPLDHGNTTDYDCYKNQLYPQTCAAGTANNTQPPIRCPYYPANDPGRDVDPNNPGLELIGPVTDQMQFVKTGPYNSWPRPSTTNFDYEMDTDDYAQFGRYVLIQDSPWYDVASLVQTQQVVTQSTPNHDVYDVWSLTGDVNDIQTAPDGGTTRRCTSNFTYRGWDTFVIFLRITRSIPEWQPVCLPNSAGKGPNIARVNGTLTPQ